MGWCCIRQVTMFTSQILDQPSQLCPTQISAGQLFFPFFNFFQLNTLEGRKKLDLNSASSSQYYFDIITSLFVCKKEEKSMPHFFLSNCSASLPPSLYLSISNIWWHLDAVFWFSLMPSTKWQAHPSLTPFPLKAQSYLPVLIDSTISFHFVFLFSCEPAV